MRLLLDSHVLLQLLSQPTSIPERARRAIQKPENFVAVSAASVWEIEITRTTGKLTAPDDLLTRIARAGFSPLPIALTHGVAAGRLPLHHRDPFDRMLVAQAQLEGLTIVTNDPKIADYQVAVLPV